MISYRQADLLERINNPIGKRMMVVPGPISGGMKPVTVSKVDGTTVTDSSGYVHHNTVFLGCRDGAAFFHSQFFPGLIGKNIYVWNGSIQEFVGAATSLEKGILRTDKGKSLDLLDYGFNQDHQMGYKARHDNGYRIVEESGAFSPSNYTSVTLTPK